MIRRKPIAVLILSSFISCVYCPLWAQEEEQSSSSENQGVAQTEQAESKPAAEEEAQPAEEAKPSEEEAGGSFTPLGVPEEQQISASPLGMNERTSLDLRSIEVSEALRFLAVKAGLNMAVSKSVAGRVQLLLNNVPIKDIFDLILITTGLAYEKIGDIYYVMTEQEYKERYGRKFSDTRKVRVFKLRYAIPEQAFQIFDLLKSEIGRLLVDPESGTVLVMDSEENIHRMETALAALEEKKAVKIYGLKYAKAVDVETRLKARLDNKKVGTVSADERTNAVIVETLPERMIEIDTLVQALDQKTREVLLDAKIIKVTLTDEKHAEWTWEGLFKHTVSRGQGFAGNHGISPVFRTGTSFIDDFAQIAVTARPTAGSKNTLTGNLILGILGEDPFEILINYLKTLGETKVLSNPKLAVVNNQEAKIHVGEKQAYVTTTTTTGQTTTTTAEAVTFIDVGIQLSVTPSINEDGFVTMKIKPEISSVTSSLTTPSGNKIPIVDSSLAETTVMVKDGISILIGGLKKEEKTSTHNKIPILGDLPVIGMPFNTHKETITHTETLILITPHIVTGESLVEGERRSHGLASMPYVDYTAPETAPTEVLPKNETLTTGKRIAQ